MIRAITILLLGLSLYAGISDSAQAMLKRTEFITSLSNEEKEKIRRDDWLRLQRDGGVIEARKTVYGCDTLENYARIMAYILYGSGEPPDKENCWIIANGTKVELVDGPICGARNEICKFSKSGIGGLFGTDFYTSIHAVKLK